MEIREDELLLTDKAMPSFFATGKLYVPVCPLSKIIFAVYVFPATGSKSTTPIPSWLAWISVTLVPSDE